MSLRHIDDQIERELSMPEPPFMVRIWRDEQGNIQSDLVPNVERKLQTRRRAAA
jgi:hypothetical protein